MGNKASNKSPPKNSKYIALIGLPNTGKSTILDVLYYGEPKTSKQLDFTTKKYEPFTKSSVTLIYNKMYMHVQEYDSSKYQDWNKILHAKYAESKLDAIVIVYDASNAPIYINLQHMESLYFVLNKWCNESQINIETIPNDIVSLIRDYLKETLDRNKFIANFLKTNYKSSVSKSYDRKADKVIKSNTNNDIGSGWNEGDYYSKPALLVVANKMDCDDTLSLNQITMSLSLNTLRDTRWFIQDIEAINGRSVWDAVNWLRNTLDH